jgi:hypothetical protein
MACPLHSRNLCIAVQESHNFPNRFNKLEYNSYLSYCFLLAVNAAALSGGNSLYLFVPAERKANQRAVFCASGLSALLCVSFLLAGF